MFKLQRTRRSNSRFLVSVSALVALALATHAAAQPAGCRLITDTHAPDEKILRCGDALTIRPAPNTRYELTGQDQKQPPGGARLESGALLLDFEPSESRNNFQILTPHAIAAVRGTKWAVEVVARRTSTLVLSGAVEVRRPHGKQVVGLGPGEGAVVSAAGGPIVAKRWARKRVDDLLARFGQ